MKNFKIISQQVYEAWIAKEITLTQWMVLIWLYQISNPTNGKSTISYRMITEQFKPFITEVNARKIITALRRHKWIYFKNHKGRGGHFPVYIHLLKLSDDRVQVLDRTTGERKIVPDDDEGELRIYQGIPDPPASSQLLEQNHNLTPLLIQPESTERMNNDDGLHNHLNLN
jgi:hypothetical protein